MAWQGHHLHITCFKHSFTFTIHHRLQVRNWSSQYGGVVSQLLFFSGILSFFEDFQMVYNCKFGINLLPVIYLIKFKKSQGFLNSSNEDMARRVPIGHRWSRRLRSRRLRSPLSYTQNSAKSQNFGALKLQKCKC